METDSSVLSKPVNSMIEWLSSYGQTERNGVTRLLYDKKWQEAQQALKKVIETLGLASYFDDVGNLYGRLEGSEKKASSVILTGSHIDTVKDGGKYDGAYGVVAGVIALDYLSRKYGQPKRTIEVVSLCEEEGSRFPLTYWGSGNITGLRTKEQVEKILDNHGIPFIQAMNEAGFGLGHFREAKRNDIDCFIELHIEQGEILERENKSIGVVSHIVGQRRYNVTVTGESDHAGTTPMHYRKDAVYTAALLIQALIEQAKETDPLLVATVGRMEIKPNIPNVIAREVVFSIDIRHSEEALLEEFSVKVFEAFKQICQKHQTNLQIDNWMNEQPVKMCEKLSDLSAAVLEKEAVPYKVMTSGAGHDAQVFGQYMPACLLFVPSHRGISHSPDEYTKAEDLEKGVQLLIKVLHKLAY
ncbi:allantoate deiminase [Neobacillus niacini]|uniref:allantoate deiminase n=1 Tax=Neobacillus niacini TaxID=86668 RepID=UPI002786580E|nr:allantoate deiminase [Neobacillus niacini]MDQ1001919.1 allantoate deiminase [Neobacillus niacini]